MEILRGLRPRRIRLALSQGELAQRAGIGRQAVSKIERGQPASFPTIRKLAQALECDPVDLYHDPDTHV